MNTFQLITLLTILPYAVVGDASPDNFLLTFDKDLRTFGVWKRRNSTPPATSITTSNRRRNISSSSCSPVNKATTHEVKEATSTSHTPANHIDNDFDRAEKRFFDVLENTERVVLKTAESLIHDEVDVLFGVDHGHSLHSTPATVEEPSDKTNQKQKKRKKIFGDHKKMTKVVMKSETKKDNEKKKKKSDENLTTSRASSILQEISDCMFE